MDDDSSSSQKQFRFDIINGTVVAYFEIENGIEELESVESQDSFEISDGQIIHKETKSDGVETTVYIDPDGNGLYTISSESSNDDSSDNNSGGSGSGDGRKAFSFEITNGEITAVFEEDDGVLKPDPIESGETYTLDGSDVIRTEVESFGIEIQRYSDSDGDGLYHRVSEQWVISDDSPGIPKPVIGDSLKYVSTDGDDLIAVRGDDSVSGGLGADSFVFREPSHLRIGDFHSHENDLLVFDTGLGLTSKEHLSSLIRELSHDGQNFIVDFTPDVSITLVGVNPDQISWSNVEVLS
jgi:hypothetical protein